MSTTTAVKEQTNIPTGYTVASVISRIMALDVDASGNAEKAAWKRYMSLCLLSLAKGWDLKKVAEQVFGANAKPSKTFQNMASLARKVRHNPELLGNHQWADVKVMAIEEAQDATIAMINRHMAVLDVSSKNEYEKFCEFSAVEAGEKRQQDADEKAAAAKAKAEADLAEKVETDKKETDAKAKADATPERTPAEAAIAALADASSSDLVQVAFHCLKGKIDLSDAIAIRDWLDNAIAMAATQIEGPAAAAA
jgi:hypothetical protein